VESRKPTEISSLNFTRTSRAYLTMSRRQLWTRGSTSTATPTRGSCGGHSRKGQSSTIKFNKKALSKMNKEISSMKAKQEDVAKAKKTFSKRQGQQCPR
jgi:hypothetical protein